MGVTQEIVMNKNQCEIRALEATRKLKADPKTAKIKIRTFCLDYPGVVTFDEPINAQPNLERP